jgi:1-acyl-sn-glycerol-3-phosphate acyltransferase
VNAEDAPPENPGTLVPEVQARVAAALRPVLRRWLELRVEGIEHVPTVGPILLAATHQSHGDSLAIGAAVPRPTHFLGDRRLLAWPVVGRRLPSLGMVPLNRGEGDEDAMNVIGRLLGSDACIVIYPEGSRSRDGRVHRLRSGLSRIAATARVTVVPVAVAGIHQVWPIGSRPRLRGGRVTVRFAPEMQPPDPTPAARRAFNLALQDRLAGLAATTTAPDFSPIHGGVASPPRVDGPARSTEQP